MFINFRERKGEGEEDGEGRRERDRRERGREREIEIDMRERNIHQLPSVCALTRDQTHNLLVYGMTLQHT